MSRFPMLVALAVAGGALTVLVGAAVASVAGLRPAEAAAFASPALLAAAAIVAWRARQR